MSDKMRWRYGDTNPVVAAVDADTVIDIGDLVWLDVDDAKPAWHLASQGDFATKFLGVAMQRSRKGDTAPIRVATTGVFEFDCDPQVFELGDKVAPAPPASKTGVFEFDCDPQTFEPGDKVAPAPAAINLSAQFVQKVVERVAIGRVAQRSSGLTTSVLVAIQSAVMCNRI